MQSDLAALVGALSEQHDELAGLLEPLAGADYGRATPCVGWDIADVVLHLSQTDTLAVATLLDRFPEAAFSGGDQVGAESVDEAAAAMVAHERGAAPTEIRDRWRVGAEQLRTLLAADDSSRRVRWVAGELSVRTLATTRLAECWIHTGDVADALGVELVPADRLFHIARLAWRTLPYAFANAGREMHGPVALELRSSTGAEWNFTPDAEPLTVIRGDALELCLVAGRRREASATASARRRTGLRRGAGA